MSQVAPSSFSVTQYLRMPALTHSKDGSFWRTFVAAMPAFAYLAVNLWLVVGGAAWFFAAILPLPHWFAYVFFALFAGPALVLTWALMVRCIEVEAELID